MVFITSNPQLLAHLERFECKSDDSEISNDEMEKLMEADVIGLNENNGSNENGEEIVNLRRSDPIIAAAGPLMYDMEKSNLITTKSVMTEGPPQPSANGIGSDVTVKCCDSCDDDDGIRLYFNGSAESRTNKKGNGSKIMFKLTTNTFVITVAVAMCVGWVIGLYSSKRMKMFSNAASPPVSPFPSSVVSVIIIPTVIVTIITTVTLLVFIGAITKPSALFEPKQTKDHLTDTSAHCNSTDSSIPPPSPLDKSLSSYRRTAASTLRESRHRIQTALGSIHANPILPAPSTQDGTADDDGNTSIERLDRRQSYSQSISSYVEANARLLHTCDRSVQSIRTATSMHLGLGPVSRSVVRVEDSVVGRYVRKVRSAGDGNSTNAEGTHSVPVPILGVTRARHILFASMRDQAKDMLSVLRLLVNMGVAIHDTHYHGDHDGDSDDDQSDDVTVSFLTESEDFISIEPMYITLSLLKAYRHHLGDLISRTSSAAWTLLHQTDEDAFIVIITHLTDNLHQADERTAHLEACFPQLDTNIPPTAHLPTDGDTSLGPSTDVEINQLCDRGGANDDTGKETATQMISNIRSQVQITFIALWALEQNILTDKSSNSEKVVLGDITNEDTTSIEHSCHSTAAITPCWYPWWKRLSYSIDMTANLYRNMNKGRFFISNILQSEIDNICEKNGDRADTNDDNSVDEYKSEAQTDKYDKDENNSIINVSRQYPLERCETTRGTVVYSARGTMAEDNDLRNKTRSTRKKDTAGGNTGIGNHSKPPPDMYHESFTGRMGLFRELQSRLEVIRLTDEEFDGTSTASHPCEEVNSERGKEGKSMLEENNQTSSEGKDCKIDMKKVAPLFLGVSGSLLSELQNAIPLSNNDHSLESSSTNI